MIGEPAHRLFFLAVVGTLAIVLVLILRLPLRRLFGARIAYGSWALVPLLVGAALLPVPALTPRLVMLAEPAGPVDALRQTVSIAAQASPLAGWWPLFAWCAGALATAALFAWRQRRFVRSLGALRPLEDNVYIAEVSLTGPALVGVRDPRVVLPADYAERYEAHELALVLAHERMHQARGDCWINAFVAAVRCVFWFNPLVHVAAGRFRFDQELACDAEVIDRFPEARRPYADAMLKTQLADPGLPVGCHWQSSHPLKERILMLKQPLPGFLRRAAGFAAVAMLSFGGGYVAWAAQPPDVVPRMYPTGVATTKILGFAPTQALDIADASTVSFLQALVDIDGRDADFVHLALPDGKPGTYANGEGADRVEVTLTAQPADDKSTDLVATLRRGDNLVGTASTRIAQGRTGVLTFTDSTGRNAGRLYASVNRPADDAAFQVTSRVDEDGKELHTALFLRAVPGAPVETVEAMQALVPAEKAEP